MDYEEREERLIHKMSMKKIQDELNDDEDEDGPFTHNERLMRGLHLVYINELEDIEDKLSNKKASQRSINTSFDNCIIILNVMLRRTNNEEWIDIIKDDINYIQGLINKRKQISILNVPLADDLLEKIWSNVK